MAVAKSVDEVGNRAFGCQRQLKLGGSEHLSSGA